MSRKTILILIAVAILALGAWLFFASKNSTGTNPDGTPKSLLSSLFPFGNGTINLPGSGTGDGQGNTGDGTADQPTRAASKLIQVSSRVVAGLAMLPSKTAPVQQHDINGNPGDEITQSVFPTIRFTESGTGYIYDIDVKGQNEKKVSETLIARTAEAIFANNGTNAILRYIKTDNMTVASFLGTVTLSTNPTAPGTLVGNFLEENIKSIAVSPDKKSFLYLLPTANGVVGISMKYDGTGKKQLFSSSFSEWLADWGTLPIITTKAADGVPGFAYSVSGGILKKILGDTNGLTTKISPDGKTLLYSVSGGQGLDLHALSLKDGTDMNTGLATLPEKCVWSTNNTVVYCGVGQSTSPDSYPDAWYKGQIHFNDAFWKIDTVGKSTTQLNDGEGNTLDATNLALDPSEQYLVLVNKTDGSLWSLNLSL